MTRSINHLLINQIIFLKKGRHKTTKNVVIHFLATLTNGLRMCIVCKDASRLRNILFFKGAGEFYIRRINDKIVIMLRAWDKKSGCIQKHMPQIDLVFISVQCPVGFWESMHGLE